MTEQNSFTHPAFQNALEVVAWFNDMGRQGGTRLRPKQLQMLLYIAQGLYAAANQGGMLMPSRFVGTSNGPVEPTLYAVLQEPINPLPAKNIDQRAEACLNLVWKKFGIMELPELEEFVTADPALAEVVKLAPGAEVPLDRMADSFYDRMIGGSRRPSIAQAEDAVAEAQSSATTTEPSIPRMTPDGKVVRKWMPTRRVN